MKMANFLGITEHPQINCEKFFEVMRDFRKGGVNPSMYDEFLGNVSDVLVTNYFI
jgi:hypothetical protein